MASSPWYLQVPAGKDGNEACLAGTAQTVAQVSIIPGEASLQLIWLPPCHSYYAMTIITSAQITEICMKVVELSSKRQAGTQQDTLQSEINEAYCPLLYSEQGPVMAIAVLVSRQTTISMHTKGLEASLPVCL